MNSDERGREYDAKFYRELEDQSASEVMPIILELARPRSMVDIGCGTGHWLGEARALGVEDILGIDGPWVDRAQLRIPDENFAARDLQAPLRLERRFDLALSLEVAEHLPASAAATFVKSLCDASEVVVFSAAIPGQGGRRHINEQWPEYWANLFQEFEYDCFDCLRPRIWQNPRVAWYYAQNCLIFAHRRKSCLPGEPGKPLPLVHPRLWSAEIDRSRRPAKLAERLFKALVSGGKPSRH
ncbi:MAG: class I SAM-dependent methyltransferase [Acidobacteria bacterium]|nr:class I SAM-dependent methyltransferase [Acidobacteriota bacterium]